MREEGAGLAAVWGGVLAVWGEAVQEEGVCLSICLSWGVPQPRWAVLTLLRASGCRGGWILAVPQRAGDPGSSAGLHAAGGGAETTAPSPPHPCPAAPSWH